MILSYNNLSIWKTLFSLTRIIFVVFLVLLLLRRIARCLGTRFIKLNLELRKTFVKCKHNLTSLFFQFYRWEMFLMPNHVVYRCIYVNFPRTDTY